MSRKAWNSTLKPGKPLKRNRGGFQFRLTPEDRAQWEWMRQQAPQPCDVCKRYTFSRCHVIPRSRGGLVLTNCVWLCEDRWGVGGFIKGCHTRQEKRTQKFMAELEAEGNPVNLFAVAVEHTVRFREETGGV